MASPKRRRTCFVTTGATATFDELVRAVLSPDFQHALQAHGYTELLVQYGQGGQAVFDRYNAQIESEKNSSLVINGFALDPAGLERYMRAAKGNDHALQRRRQQDQSDEVSTIEGVVVSHAGSGSVLEALRLSVPLIVVANSGLLDNHQLELAEALAEQGYVVHGKIDTLAAALDEAEVLARRAKEWPPVNSGVHRQARGLKGVIDEEMGFLD